MIQLKIFKNTAVVMMIINNNYDKNTYLDVCVFRNTKTEKACLSDWKVVIWTGFGPRRGGGQLKAHREVSC